MLMIISDKQFDEERALYNLCDATVENCIFAGAADGESALKESRNVTVKNCRFDLRYPLWHTELFSVENSVMNGTARAAVWYSSNGKIKECSLNGIKALRECKNIEILNTEIDSPEFGWRCDGIKLSECNVSSEYFFFESSGIFADELNMNGKYSFQYVKNCTVKNSSLYTKDAFWHAENVTVTDCTVSGEYLGWYSNGLKFINCKIIGTQPLCYCKNLVLENCTMESTDFAFEYSQVNADVKGNIQSVKNPLSGCIVADSISEIINKDNVRECNCVIKIRN